MDPGEQGRARPALAPVVAWRSVVSSRSGRAAAILGVALLVLVLLGPALVSLLGLPDPNLPDAGNLEADGAPTGLSSQHLLGVDELGRDVLSRLLDGGWRSAVVAAGATAIAFVLGSAVGVAAGLGGRRTDAVLSAVVDLALSFPVLVLALGLGGACTVADSCLGGALRPGLGLTMMILGVATWAPLARVVRAQTVAIRGSAYVEAARALGASTPRLALHEIAPNLTAPVLVWVSFALPANLLAEAALAFLGVGVPAPAATWGSMLATAAPSVETAWWAFAPPAAAIVCAAGACIVLADGLQDALRRTEVP